MCTHTHTHNTHTHAHTHTHTIHTHTYTQYSYYSACKNIHIHPLTLVVKNYTEETWTPKPYRYLRPQASPEHKSDYQSETLSDQRTAATEEQCVHPILPWQRFCHRDGSFRDPDTSWRKCNFFSLRSTLVSEATQEQWHCGNTLATRMEGRSKGDERVFLRELAITHQWFLKDIYCTRWTTMWCSHMFLA